MSAGIKEDQADAKSKAISCSQDELGALHLGSAERLA